MLTPRLRNNKTACRNSEAPISATVDAPPAVSMSATMAAIATWISSSAPPGTTGTAGHFDPGRSMRARATNAQNITRVICGGVLSRATLARCR